MSLYVVVVLAVPVVIAFASTARARLALALTIAATWAVTLFAYERLVPDRDELTSALTFFLVYVHLVTGPVAGTLASMLVPRAKSMPLATAAAFIGSAAAVALRYVIPLVFGDDRIARALDVVGPVVFASTAAVLVASITARKPA